MPSSKKLALISTALLSAIPAPLLAQDPPALIPFRKKDLWGYVNAKAEFIIPPTYRYAEPFSDGVACVGVYVSTSELLRQGGVKYGFIDTSGKMVIEPRLRSWTTFENGMAQIVGVDVPYLVGRIDKTGTVVVPPYYDSLEFFTKDHAIARLGIKYGLIDRTGKTILAAKYEDAMAARDDGLMLVKWKGKWGCVDPGGKEVLPAKYDFLGRFSKGLAPAGLNGKSGVINRGGEPVIPFEHDSVSGVSEGVFYLKSKGKDGVLWKDGKAIMNLPYDRLYKLEEGLIQVESAGKYGILDADFKELIAPMHESWLHFSEGLARVKVGKLSGFMDKSGAVVIPAVYLQVGFFKNGLAQVFREGKPPGYIDRKGQTYWED